MATTSAIIYTGPTSGFNIYLNKIAGNNICQVVNIIPQIKIVGSNTISHNSGNNICQKLWP